MKLSAFGEKFAGPSGIVALMDDLGTALNEVQTLATENRLPEALERVEAILADHPREPRALALQAKILFSIGRREEGLAAIVEARELRVGHGERLSRVQSNWRHALRRDGDAHLRAHAALARPRVPHGPA